MDRVIEINAQSDPNVLVDLTENREVDVEFTYIVKWKETDTSFEKRMEKYSQSSSLPHHLEIYWFSIINSCATVLLLTTFLATILMRVLKNDFVRYTHDEETADDQVETGWKYIHGDVFSTLFIFTLALVGVFYPYNRRALFTALVVIYALTSGIAGYTATSFYCHLEGTNWVCGKCYFFSCGREASFILTSVAYYHSAYVGFYETCDCLSSLFMLHKSWDFCTAYVTDHAVYICFDELFSFVAFQYYYISLVLAHKLVMSGCC
ncbi:Cellular adhesion and filamentous growth protein [Ancistrocladus abbreviatus]